MSTFMASIVWIVSARLSPFTTELVEPPMERLSAERRFSASSNELLVRVEGSRKRFNDRAAAQRRDLFDGPAVVDRLER